MTRSAELPDARALGLFDPSGTAHSGNALRGLARAAFEPFMRAILTVTGYDIPQLRSTAARAAALLGLALDL